MEKPIDTKHVVLVYSNAKKLQQTRKACMLKLSKSSFFSALLLLWRWKVWRYIGYVDFTLTFFRFLGFSKILYQIWIKTKLIKICAHRSFVYAVVQKWPLLFLICVIWPFWRSSRTPISIADFIVFKSFLERIKSSYKIFVVRTTTKFRGYPCAILLGALLANSDIDQFSRLSFWIFPCNVPSLASSVCGRHTLCGKC